MGKDFVIQRVIKIQGYSRLMATPEYFPESRLFVKIRQNYRVLCSFNEDQRVTLKMLENKHSTVV